MLRVYLWPERYTNRRLQCADSEACDSLKQSSQPDRREVKIFEHLLYCLGKFELKSKYFMLLNEPNYFGKTGSDQICFFA
jgi:hypothetical protein